jgi:hypothetical protein
MDDQKSSGNVINRAVHVNNNDGVKYVYLNKIISYYTLLDIIITRSRTCISHDDAILN